MRSTAELIGEFISNMNTTIEVLEVESVGVDTYKIKVKCTSFAFECLPLFYNSNNYRILEVSDKEITIQGTPAPLIGSYNLDKPYYISGTQKICLEQFRRLQKENKPIIFPIIWLSGINKEVELNDWESPLERICEYNMWFLTKSNLYEWLMPDHFNLINAMRNLARSFFTQIQNTQYFGEINTKQTYYEHANAGYSNETGHFKQIFDMGLSGVQVIGQLPIKKSNCIGCN